MSLPFNSYDQMRYRGNEYVTDQTLNRTVYRLFQNDVYLDSKFQEHIADDSAHYTDNSDTVIDYLTSDKQVILAAHYNSDGTYQSGVDVIQNATIGTYSEKTWQRLIDEQPKNLGGHTLNFRFQKSQTASKNPDTITNVINMDVIKFADFYGGTLIIESPIAYAVSGGSVQNYQDSTSAINQYLVICSNRNANAIIDIENCHCKVLIRNCNFKLVGINNYIDIGVDGPGDWINKDKDVSPFNTKESGAVFCNFGNGGTKEMKRYSSSMGRWIDLNMLSAVRVTKSPDVEIKHCYIQYYYQN